MYPSERIANCTNAHAVFSSLPVLTGVHGPCLSQSCFLPFHGRFGRAVLHCLKTIVFLLLAQFHLKPSKKQATSVGCVNDTSHFFSIFSCAGRRRRQWRSRGGTNRRSGFTKEPEAAGQGAPAHSAPQTAAGEFRRQSAQGVYGSQLYYRSLAPAACTAGRGLGRQWPPPTGDGSGTHPGHVCIGSGSTAAG
jgi:hypothetical protein